MVFPQLTDMSAKELRGLLEGRTIAIYHKQTVDSPSDSLFYSKFSSNIRKASLKYPKDHSYMITSRAKYAYKLIINHILDFCKAGKVSHITRRDFVDTGNTFNALKDLEMGFFAMNVYHRMESMAAGPLISTMIGEVYHEFDDDASAWTRAMAVRAIAEAKFCGRLSTKTAQKYYVGKICQEFDDDVRRALAEMHAAAPAENTNNT